MIKGVMSAGEARRLVQVRFTIWFEVDHTSLTFDILEACSTHHIHTTCQKQEQRSSRR